MKLSRTLSGRLTVYTVLTFTLLLLVCFTLLYWSINRMLMQSMDEDLMEDISEFSHTLSNEGISGVIDEINKETANDEHESVFLMLLDSDLTLIHQSDMYFWNGLEPDFSLVRAQLSNAYEPVILTMDLDSQEARTRTIYGRLSPEHVLILGESTEDHQDITELLVFAFTAVFLLAIPIASLLVWLVTRRTVSGIHRVSVAAKGFSKGDLDSRANLQGQLEEVQSLADTFDAMAGRLQALIHHMREMTDNIAHDLRSPLGRIRLISESLLHKPPDSRQIAESVDHTVSECDRLIRMIDLSLDVAEAEAGVLTLHTQTLDLSDLCRDACDFFEPAMELKQIALLRSIERACHVKADSNSLQRLLSNLLDNALKYTPEGGEISVAMKRMNGCVVTEVADNGIGIPPISLNHVFDRFYRADSSRGGMGCGLGLSYAHAVAKAHGGELTVSSIPGKRTVFRLRLHETGVGRIVSRQVSKQGARNESKTGNTTPS
ncbi:ATP-binding protein [Granulosicoccus sp. 3-233]|uniref:sensor histidine kinase n=1 Tax=Granulosicoccus sp. 3-233 TaxID=3417969 RepID=UPI003D33012C